MTTFVQHTVSSATTRGVTAPDTSGRPAVQRFLLGMRSTLALVTQAFQVSAALEAAPTLAARRAVLDRFGMAVNGDASRPAA